MVAVYTGDDMAARSTACTPGSTIGINHMPGIKLPTFYALATDKVRYYGDPIALVVAESRAVAEDTLELIIEDIEMLDPIVTYADALDPEKPSLFEEFGRQHRNEQ